MADGASAIVGLMTFATAAFKGCCEAYQLLSAARHAHKDIENLICSIEWEEYRFIQWGYKTGLARNDREPRQNLPWHLIQDTLRQLSRLFEHANRMREYYGLTRDRESSEADPAGLSYSKESNNPGPSLRIWAYVGADLKAIRAHTKRSTDVARRFRWVAVDRTKIRRLISDLGAFNNQLHSYLATQDQDFIRSTLALLLQDLVARSSQGYDLETLKFFGHNGQVTIASAIEAAAELKQVRMSIKFDRRPHEQSVPVTTGRKAIKTVKFSRLELLDGDRKGCVARYRSSQRIVDSLVFLDWKDASKIDEKRLRRRVENLTLLLSNASDPSFSVLRCLGYTSKENTVSQIVSFAYIFELAPFISDQQTSNYKQVDSLNQAIDKTRDQVTLSERVIYARRLCQAVLQLHIAGWLHKAIRPDNLLFLPEQRQDRTQPRGPYLIGFSHARADNPLEMTEDPIANEWTNLYTHPEYLARNRPGYRKVFDLYSLGCVLVELAVWRSLREILETEGLTPSPVGLHTPENLAIILKRVAFSAGNSFATAVQLCFQPKIQRTSKDNGDWTENDEDNEDEEDCEDILESSIYNQLKIAELVNSCIC